MWQRRTGFDLRWKYLRIESRELLQAALTVLKYRRSSSRQKNSLMNEGKRRILSQRRLTSYTKHDNTLSHGDAITSRALTLGRAGELSGQSCCANLVVVPNLPRKLPRRKQHRTGIRLRGIPVGRNSIDLFFNQKYQQHPSPLNRATSTAGQVHLGVRFLAFDTASPPELDTS